MAGWRGALIGTAIGLLAGPYVAPYMPETVRSVLGELGTRFIIALIAAWVGAFLGDLIGVVRARNSRAKPFSG